MTTGKTTASTMGTLVGKVMSLLFNTLCRFIIGSRRMTIVIQGVARTMRVSETWTLLGCGPIFISYIHKTPGCCTVSPEGAVM